MSDEEYDLDDEEESVARRRKLLGVNKSHMIALLGILGVTVLLAVLDATGVLSSREIFARREVAPKQMDGDLGEKQGKGGMSNTSAQAGEEKPASTKKAGKNAAPLPANAKQRQPRAQDKAVASTKQQGRGGMSAMQKAGPAPQPGQKVSLGAARVGVNDNYFPVCPPNTRRVLSDINNHSDKPIENASVDVEFYNRKGEVVLVRRVNPLAVSGGVFGDVTRPLKPGEKRLFAASIDHVPNNWSGEVKTSLSGPANHARSLAYLFGGR
ncbi:hypothetical protein [Magnetofaba australis]|uniref:Uncharacterized protein n=1 Tax=Magnetofaba australis IT-1 TaxID=1434232 RepID=A0A1Y2K6M2_9PROT|nr:hypothetical protein [Magnetofaba australis]OSM04998.1 hypothetical protein MAIT1_03126 [Magnetofaba australis IT-1]